MCLGEHVCQLYVLPCLGLSLIAVALLFAVPTFSLLDIKWNGSF